MPARTLEETILDLVHGLAADLVPLVRQAALDSAREALGREGVRAKVTHVVEVVAIEPAPRRRSRVLVENITPPSMPRQFTGAQAMKLDDAILRHLAAHPGLRGTDSSRAFVASVASVKRAVTVLSAPWVVANSA